MEDVRVDDSVKDDHVEKPGWSAPPRPPNGSRKWMYSRASSLLDDEEEILHKEAALMCVSEEESDELNEEKNKDAEDSPKDNMIETNNALVTETTHDIDMSMGSLAILAEDMASYLCPVTYENCGTNPGMSARHGRTGSETDFLQQQMSTGNCGTNACFGRKALLPNLTSTASSLKPEELSYQRVLRNRSSVRAAQTRRVQQLWNNWHSTPGDSPAGANECASPRRSVPNTLHQGDLSPQGWSVHITKSLDGELEASTPVSAIASPMSYTAFTPRIQQVDCDDLLNVETVSDLYYDSDPEVYVSNRESNDESDDAAPRFAPLLLSRSRSEPTTMRSRRLAVPPPIDTTVGETRKVVRPLTPKNSGRKRKSMNMEGFDLDDDQHVLDFIEVRRATV